MAMHEVPDEPTWNGRTPRGPVTPDEALAVHQRSYAVGISRRRPKPDGVIEAPPPWPTEVPSSGDQRQMAAFRLDPEALAYARARAALEGMPLSTVLDRLLRAWASYPPGWWPTEWEQIDEWEDAELPGGVPPLPRAWRERIAQRRQRRPDAADTADEGDAELPE